MGSFERSGFVKGAVALKVDSLASLKGLLPELSRKASYGHRDFDAVYKFAFGWGCEPGIRNLKKEVAIGLWSLLIPRSAFALLEEWVSFWHASPARVVTKDEWNSFKRFVELHQTNKTLIESDDAWPTAIDDFVEYVKTSAAKAGRSKQ
jgi:hypothetical protein